VTVDDGLAFEDEGSGPPLVLIHGLATTRVIWRHVVPSLRASRRVIALDVPGFGESPPAGPGFVLDAVAARIAHGLERAGVEGPFDLVGHSMGGAVALALAARRPEAVGRMVLVAPAGLRPMPAVAARAFGAAAARAIPLRRRAAALADYGWGRRLLMTPGTVDPAALAPAEVRALVDASRGATRIAEALSAVASADLRPLLGALPVAVGAVWGDRDRIIPPGAVGTVLALRPGAPAATVPSAGHIPMVERPAPFLWALEHVLEALSRPGNNRGLDTD
jgi:pimeloyl-ACP methyl ester carboxylesterase